MKTITYLSIVLILSGCARLNGVKFNQHLWYQKSLSKAEKDSINVHGSIVKDWNGTNHLGDYTRGKIQVRKQDKGNKFDFVEIGCWVESNSVSAAKGWKAVMKDSITYDNYGNIIIRRLYLNEGKSPDSNGFLFEEWRSAKTDSLRQEIINYHKNGQISSKQFVTVKNPEKYGSDYSKEKYLVKLEVFDEQGLSLPESSYQGYQWYLPKTIMRKK